MWQILGLISVALALYTVRRSWSRPTKSDYIEMNAARVASLHSDAERQVRERE